ncbi:methanogen output domain 1-containing protein [Methanobacterium sp.]|uniref:response regulator n=1 Tax=Methanobacterium sp. TaxID=2164 RepID=UPI003C71ED07
MTKNKILVVEDDFITAMEIKRLLESYGYSCHSASSSDDAFDQAIKIDPDLILMDVKIRGNDDGIGTTKRIKKMIDVPVIYLTAYTDHDLMESIKLTRPAACILKPFETNELISNIEIALYTHSADLNREVGILNNGIIFYTMIGNLLASKMDLSKKNSFLTEFSRNFEEKLKKSFMEEAGKLKIVTGNRDLCIYINCLSHLLSNLGFINNRMSNDSNGYMIINNCPWKTDKYAKEIFCCVCKTITKLTFSWMDLEGHIKLENSLLSNDCFCGFRFELESTSPDEHPLEVL